MRIKATSNFFIVFCLLAVLFIDSRAWWRRRRRRRSSPPPRCHPQDCSYSWSSWSSCSCPCGDSCTRTRRVWIDAEENNCGSCPYKEGDSQKERCNENACENAYFALSEGCYCQPGWKGTCCENG